MKTERALFILALSVGAQVLTASAQGTAFTYQGRLNNGGAPATGSYDLTFTLFNVSSGPGSVAGPLTNAATGVTNGLFTVTLDFGNQFPGVDRWLEIGVRNNGAGPFTTLTPRQLLTPSPYAITANSLSGTLAAGQLSGTIPPANIANGTISAAMLVSGAVGSNQLAAGAVTTSALADNAVTLPKLRTVFDAQLAFTIKDPYNTNLSTVGPTGCEPLAEVGNNHLFGKSVAALQSFIIVGSPGRDFYWLSNGLICNFYCGGPCVLSGLIDAGAVYLFAPDGSPIFGTTLPEALASENAQFGFSVAGMGVGTIVAGAPGTNRAYIINTNGSYVATLYPSTPNPVRFGHAVAGLSDGKVAVSDPDYFSGSALGVVSRFSSGGGGLSSLFAPAGVNRFGFSLANTGSDLLVGSDGSGAFYYVNGTALFASFTNYPHGTGFGRAVAPLGFFDRVIIGAPIGQGIVFLYDLTGTLLKTISNPSSATDPGFGSLVSSIGTDKIVIGATSGKTFLFDTNGILLGLFNNPSPGSTPSCLSSLGNQVVVGFPDALPNGFGRGAVQVFNLDGPDFMPGLTVERGSVTTVTIADGAVTAAKIGGVLDGAQIPNLDASKITTGTLADARLSANVPLLNSGKLNDSVLPNNAALRSGGNTFSGSQNFTGGGSIITLDNMVDIYAKNSSGQVEGLLTGRWSDDATYLTYGSGGFFIRNHVSTPTMIFSSAGNVGIGIGNPSTKLHVIGDVTFSSGAAGANQTVSWSPGNASWSFTSDRNAKDRIEPVDVQSILEKVTNLQINEWNYIGYDQRHIGPMAQDFHTQFPFNENEKSLNDADLHGVALAAIQGLNKKLEQKETEITELKDRLEKLERWLNDKQKGGEK